MESTPLYEKVVTFPECSLVVSARECSDGTYRVAIARDEDDEADVKEIDLIEFDYSNEAIEQAVSLAHALEKHGKDK